MEEPLPPDGSDHSADIERSVGEEVDGQLVSFEAEAWGATTVPRAEVARSERSVPVTLLPAVAAGSFAAGAAVMTYVHRRRSAPRSGARRRSALQRTGGATAARERLQIVGSRSILLDVHLLGRGGR